MNKSVLRILILSFLCAITFSGKTNAQVLAFPGAEGAGAYVTGGRGTVATPTTVFEVTNLSDVNSVGSLRYAVNATATYRTIVFRISGTIHLTSKLSIKANTTIAGQTAPGGGICIADYPVSVSGDNVIIRYIRCRMGDRYQNTGMVDGAGSDDALGSLGSKKLIIDHCSVSWSTDEALTVYRGDSVTLQWNLISEPLNYSYHFETGDTDFEHHGYGGIWGGRKASFHHNLFAHTKNRSPRFSGTYNGIADTCDLRNNVIYDWGINNVYGGEGGFYNVVNNYYKQGPSTTSRNYQMVAVDYSDTQPYAKYYLTGNYMTGSPTFTASNWKSVSMKSGVMADTSLSKVLVPFNLPVLASQTTAQQAYLDVLAGAGAILPERDTLDQRIINDVKNGTGRLIDVQGGFPHGTAYNLTVNAWPTLVATTAPIDTDHDGMPDDYETANSLNPNSAADRNTRNTDGYTALEVYLNSITANTTSNGGTSVSATWPLSANVNPTIVGNITASDQTMDANMTIKNYNSFTAGTANDGTFVPYTAQRVIPNGGNTTTPVGWPSSQTGEVANQWVQYTIAPTTGQTLDINSISIDFGPAGSTNTMKANVEYSLDNFATAGIKLNSSALTLPAIVSNDNSAITISYSGLNIPVSSGSTFYLRVYPWWPSTASTSKYLVEKNVIITGTSSTSLPLNFLSFNGELKQSATSKVVSLNWTTTNEVNTKKFEILRSEDGKVFLSIGEVKSNSTLQRNEYGFIDSNPLKGVAYYKLKQIDQDGQFTESKTIFINNKFNTTINVFPNPVQDILNLNHNIVTEASTLKIYTTNGQLVLENKLQLGSQQEQISLGDLKAGTYVLSLLLNGKTESLVFVKK